MQIDLTGKTALVTASTAGIGLAIAIGLARSGATVIVNGRRQDTVEGAIADVVREVPGATVRGVAADVGSAEGCDAIVAAEPAVDILVNNAGIYGPRDFYELSDEDWTRIFDVNVMSGVRLARAYTGAMAASGWGRVVFISSESALNTPEDMIHYGFSKTAQLAVSRGLAKRLSGTGVTVNAVLPGPTLSDGLREMLREDAEKAGCRSRRRPPSSSRRIGPARSCSARPRWRRSRTWWSTSVRRRPRRPPAPRCESMAAWWTPSLDAGAQAHRIRAPMTRRRGIEEP